MSKLLSCLFVVLLTFGLTACNEKYTYDYLVTHPQFLRSEITRCQKMKTATKLQKHQCDIVVHTAGKFMAQVTIQQADPEQFGETIMKAEVDLANKKTLLENASVAYEAAKAKKASPVELTTAAATFEKAKKDYLDQRRAVREMLGVVGMGNPT